MSRLTAAPGQYSMQRQRPRAPARRRFGLLHALAAMALLAAVFVVAVTDSGALAQDTPTEDAPAEETPTADAPAEETPTEDPAAEETPTEDPAAEDPPAEDSPADDGSEEGTPAEGEPAEEGAAAGSPEEGAAADTAEDRSSDETATDESPGADVPPEEASAEQDSDGDVVTEEPAAVVDPAPEGPDSVLSGHYGCPQRPPSIYHDDVPSWSDWCLDPDYWIVEVTCGSEFTNARQTVRFDAEHALAAQLVMYDLCGNLDLIGACPPVPGAGPFDTSGDGRRDPSVPGPEIDESRGAASDFGAAVDQAPDPSGLAETALELAGIGEVAAGLDESVDAALAPDAISEDTAGSGAAVDEATAPAGRTEPTGAGEQTCGPVWPPGTWYQFTRRDPITGVITAGGRVTGSWLGPRHHTAADVPAFIVNCTTTGQFGVVVHTGGVVVATYGHGIPVEYRVGDTVRIEEWNELDAPESPRAGVALPRWFMDEFVELLRAHPDGEFPIRVFGHDGAVVGLATFDLAAIEMVLAPVRGTCLEPTVAEAVDEA